MGEEEKSRKKVEGGEEARKTDAGRQRGKGGPNE